MNRIKFIKYALLLIVIILSSWYFLIKDYNYKITFTTSQATGIVYNALIKWDGGKNSSNNNLTILNKIPFSEVHQKFVSGDTVYTFNWLLQKKNDSTTLVIAKIKDEKHSFKQNLQAIFYKNAFVKKSTSIVKSFGEDLIQHAKSYKLSKVTEGKIPSQNCAYISLESKLQDKASTMLKNIAMLTNYIKDNNIELTGSPFLEITAWDIKNDQIKFDFCFPIKEQNIYPETNTIKFKKTETKDALKTVFNGNYRISDKAWYTLIDYANSNNIELEKLPVEFYLNDPHSGGNPLEWEAEVYMPIIY
jgi:effector-binding domain-containing protein